MSKATFCSPIKPKSTKSIINTENGRFAVVREHVRLLAPKKSKPSGKGKRNSKAKAVRSPPKAKGTLKKTTSGKPPVRRRLLFDDYWDQYTKDVEYAFQVQYSPENRPPPPVQTKAMECSICLEPLDWRQALADGTSHLLMVRECGHTFHGACNAQWSRVRDNCPICRH